MIAKFKNGTPCTIRALLSFAEKHHYVNFIVLTDGMFITIKSIDRKDNGRIKHIEFDILAPSYICKAGDSYYKKATFSGKEKVANDFLDTWVFSFGIRVDEDAMAVIPSLDGAELIWSADQEKKIEAIKEKLLSEHDPRLLMFSTKWILHSMNQENKLKDKFVLKEPVICKEAPKKSLDEMLSEGIPPLKKKLNPRTIMVSSACEGMMMDTD